MPPHKALDPHQVLGAVLGVLAGWISLIPGDVRQAAVIATVLMCLDALTGIFAAGIEHNIGSHQMTEKWARKIQVYFTVSILAGITVPVMGNWSFVYLTSFGICGIELTSILENLRRIDNGQNNLGPFSPLIKQLTKYFAVGQLPTSQHTVMHDSQTGPAPKIQIPAQDDEEGQAPPPSPPSDPPIHQP